MPYTNLQDLFRGERGALRRQRFVQNMQLGWKFTEDYAGMSCFTQALGQVGKAARDLEIISPATFPFQIHRASDVDTLCQRVLGADLTLRNHNCSHALHPCHIQGEIDARLKPPLRAQLDLREPSPTMTKAEKRVAFMNTRSVLRATIGTDLHTTENSTAYCYIHNTECPAFPKKYTPLHASTDDEPLCEHNRPWLGNVAGYSCIGWSSRGKGEGEAHSSGRAYCTWACERNAGFDDVAFGECTVNFNQALAQDSKTQLRNHKPPISP